MAVIRKASLDSHAAARDVGEDNPARSSARSALGAAIYAQQAICRATNSDDAVVKEREWQYQHLIELMMKY